MPCSRCARTAERLLALRGGWKQRLWVSVLTSCGDYSAAVSPDFRFISERLLAWRSALGDAANSGRESNRVGARTPPHAPSGALAGSLDRYRTSASGSLPAARNARTLLETAAASQFIMEWPQFTGDI